MACKLHHKACTQQCWLCKAQLIACACSHTSLDFQQTSSCCACPVLCAGAGRLRHRHPGIFALLATTAKDEGLLGLYR
jgi:hypothetical protein